MGIENGFCLGAIRSGRRETDHRFASALPPETDRTSGKTHFQNSGDKGQYPVNRRCVQWVDASSCAINTFRFKCREVQADANRLMMTEYNKVLDRRQHGEKPEIALRETISIICPSSKRMLAEKGKPTLHSCRDTYAIRLLNNGMPLEKVSHLLGHASLQQTQKYARFAKRPAADEARAILNRTASLQNR